MIRSARSNLIIFFLILIMIAGCGDKEQSGKETVDKTAVYPTIVSLSPNVTEILYAIGAGENVIGVTSFCDYPPEAKEKQSVGGLVDTSYEIIAGLKPDYVIDLETQVERIRKLKQMKMNVVIVSNETIFDVLQAITQLGELVERDKEASDLRTDLEMSLNQIRMKLRVAEKPKVAFVIDHSLGALQDVFVAGSMNFVDELIQYAGGENIFADLGKGYHQVNQEAFYHRAPDVIFDVTKSGEDVYSELTVLSAVKNGAVYYSFDEIIQIPGPRLVESLRYMAQKLHPEIDFDSKDDAE